MIGKVTTFLPLLSAIVHIFVAFQFRWFPSHLPNSWHNITPTVNQRHGIYRGLHGIKTLENEPQHWNFKNCIPLILKYAFANFICGKQIIRLQIWSRLHSSSCSWWHGYRVCYPAVLFILSKLIWHIKPHLVRDIFPLYHSIITLCLKLWQEWCTCHRSTVLHQQIRDLGSDSQSLPSD